MTEPTAVSVSDVAALRARWSVFHGGEQGADSRPEPTIGSAPVRDGMLVIFPVSETPRDEKRGEWCGGRGGRSDGQAFGAYFFRLDTLPSQ